MTTTRWTSIVVGLAFGTVGRRGMRASRAQTGRHLVGDIGLGASNDIEFLEDLGRPHRNLGIGVAVRNLLGCRQNLVDAVDQG